MRIGWESVRIAALAALAALPTLLATPARAVVIPLTFEFDAGVEGDYGSITLTDVTEQGMDGVLFQIQLGPDLGPDPDLHTLHLNAADGVSGLRLESDDPVATPYRLEAGSSVRGGAGSSFDYSVFFGNGGGPKGNGRLTTASFTLFADSGLSTAELLHMSQTAGGLESFFAVHVQNTGPGGGGSETVGGNAVIPEPASFTLLGGGLLGLALGGRRRALRR